jgi:hypothetical protein
MEPFISYLMIGLGVGETSNDQTLRLILYVVSKPTPVEYVLVLRKNICEIAHRSQFELLELTC